MLVLQRLTARNWCNNTNNREETHSYLEVKKVFLTSLSIMVATTHAHWDHIGGHKYSK